MRTRLYLPGTGPGSDAAGLDIILDENRDHDVQLNYDRVIVSRHGPDDTVVGCLAWRPVSFVHELVLARSLPRGLGVARRVAAQSMIAYAVGEARARQYDIRRAAFLVDEHNATMLRFVREIGATEQRPGLIFTLDF